MSYTAPAYSLPTSPTYTAPKPYDAPAYFAVPMSYPEYMQMYTDFTRGNERGSSGSSSLVPPQRHSTILQVRRWQCNISCLRRTLDLNDTFALTNFTSKQDHQKRSAGDCNSSAHERGESDTEEAIVREASNLKNMYVEKRDGLVTLLSGQLGTLKQLAQVL